VAVTYAIIEHLGHQYLVSEGKEIELLGHKYEIGDEIRAEKVLLVSDEQGVRAGQPTLEDAVVILKVVEKKLGDKVTVFRYQPKKNFKKKRGHRDKIVLARVESIRLEG